MPVRIFGIRLGKPAPEPPPTPARAWNDPWAGLRGTYEMVWGSSWGTGPDVSLDQALTVPAFYACVDVLQDQISRTPFDSIRYTDRGRVPVTPKPQIIASPSSIVTEDVWRAEGAFHQVTDGNAFGWITEYSPRGLPVRVEWIDPCRVVERGVVDGVPTVKLGPSRESHRLYPYGDVFHVPGRVIRKGPFAESPLQAAAKPLRVLLAIDAYTQGWFASDGHPTLEVVVEGALTEEQAKQLKADTMRARETREPWIHSSMMTAKALQETPDTAVTAIKQEAMTDVARALHVPPAWMYLAMSGQNVTYANLSQADVDGMNKTLDGYLHRWEKALSTCLPAPQQAKANRDVSLRMDPKSRTEVEVLRLQNNLTSVNEIRRIEDEEPFDGPAYDQPGVPSAPTTTDPEAGADGTSD